jgi:hypothetical protein
LKDVFTYANAPKIHFTYFNTKINYGMDTRGEKEERTSKKNMDGRSTGSHDETFRTRPMDKQRGMAFGFRKTATAVNKTR